MKVVFPLLLDPITANEHADMLGFGFLSNLNSDIGIISTAFLIGAHSSSDDG
jgi:hypothetical protein